MYVHAILITQQERMQHHHWCLALELKSLTPPGLYYRSPKMTSCMKSHQS